MSPRMDELLNRLRELEEAVQSEIDERRAEFRYRVKQGRVEFDAEMRRHHRELREGWLSFLSHTRFLTVITAPVIYALIIPFVLLDLFVTLYQAICFPVYKLEKVRRADYLAVDRHQLAYLNGLQKLNCVYCGYCNGLIAYVREIAARTEAYWCPIKHARRIAGAHDHYGAFSEFGDGEAFLEDLARLRERAEKAARDG